MEGFMVTITVSTGKGSLVPLKAMNASFGSAEADPHLVRWVLRQGGHPHEHPNIPPHYSKENGLSSFLNLFGVFLFVSGFVPEVPGGPWRFLEVPTGP